MDNDNNEYKWKNLEQLKLKQSKIVNNMLNINNSKNGEFSLDEYNDAIFNERTKRANNVKLLTEPLDVRYKNKLIQLNNDPNYIEKVELIKTHVMTERVNQILNSKIRNTHEHAYEIRKSMILERTQYLNEWNINNIQMEKSDNNHNIAKIIISKRRSAKYANTSNP